MAYEVKWFGGDLWGCIEGDAVAQFFTNQAAADKYVAELNDVQKSMKELGKLAELPPVEHVGAGFVGGENPQVNIPEEWDDVKQQWKESPVMTSSVVRPPVGELSQEEVDRIKGEIKANKKKRAGE